MGQEKLEWMLSGDLVEGCTSPPVCPILWRSPAPKDLHDGKSQCEGVFNFHIQKGYYRNINLDGLNVSYGFNTPTGVPEVWWPWKCILFIDAVANNQQAEALEEIYKRCWEQRGEVLVVKRAEISFTKDLINGGPTARHTVEIKGVYNLRTEPLLTMDGKPRYINSIVGGIIYVGKSEINEFNDADLPRTWNRPGMSTQYYDFALTPEKLTWLP